MPPHPRSPDLLERAKHFARLFPPHLAIAISGIALLVVLLTAVVAHAQHRANVAPPGVNQRCGSGKNSAQETLDPLLSVKSDVSLPESEKTAQKWLCDVEEAQFDRYILVITDALPRDCMHYLLDYYGPKTGGVSFRIDIPGVKYSHAVFDAYWRGQLPTNTLGDTLQGDTLWNAMLRSPASQSLRPIFVGPNWPIADVMPEVLRETLFVDHVNVNERGYKADSDAFPALFGRDAGKNGTVSKHDHAPVAGEKWYGDKSLWNLNGLLHSAATKGHSLTLYTAVLDHMQHDFKPVREAELIKRTTRRINTHLEVFKEFVEDHPDYLLVFLADHGFDSFDPEPTLHGHTR
jgi:hypothetical protein